MEGRLEEKDLRSFRREVDGGGDKLPYLETALTQLAAGQEIATPQTSPYGCSVKYGRS